MTPTLPNPEQQHEGVTPRQSGEACAQAPPDVCARRTRWAALVSALAVLTSCLKLV